MELVLGVCKALKAMHQYKVQGGSGGVNSQKKARRIREEAAEADRDAAEHRGEEEVENEPLMDGEVTRSQDGIAPGGERAYAHRDIKPGVYFLELECSNDSATN
jgi:serine/threonine kinase 16